jgi:DNA polymerase/3'-5' exonuclease PolX
MRYDKARELAINTGNKLLPFCEKINIAGSIRRQKQEVKDIEIVCLPRHTEGAQASMFETVAVEKVISTNFVAIVKTLGKVIKGKPDGRYMQIELPQRVNLDLFMPDPVDYYRQLVIRTGSADYVARTIATAWKRKGWCGSDQGLRRIIDCIEHPQPGGKKKFECVVSNAEKPPVWQSEAEFYDWLGIPMIMPKLRTI